MKQVGIIRTSQKIGWEERVQVHLFCVMWDVRNTAGDVCLCVMSGGYGSCRSDEFMCSHPRRCITQRWVCDLDRDCEDGSDETDCSTSLVLSV